MESDRVYLTAENVKFQVPDKKKGVLTRGEPGKKVILGVRAADIKLSQTETSGYDACGAVTITEPLGWTTLVECAIGGKVINLLSEDQEYNAGQEVYLKFDPEKTHYFEKESGAAIR